MLRTVVNLPHLTFGGMSQAVRTDRTVRISGQVALGPDGLVGDGDIRAQSEQVFRNLGELLEAAGSSVDDIVKLTCFLVNADDFTGYSEVKSLQFAGDPPASSTVVVAELLDPRFLLEVEAEAVIR